MPEFIFLSCPPSSPFGCVIICIWFPRIYVCVELCPITSFLVLCLSLPPLPPTPNLMFPINGRFCIIPTTLTILHHPNNTDYFLTILIFLIWKPLITHPRLLLLHHKITVDSSTYAPSVYLLFSEQQKCVPEQQITKDERYVFLRRPWYENDSLIHVLCASSQLWGSHGGAVLLDHSGHSPLTLTHLIHEYIMTIFHGIVCRRVASAVQH